MDELNVADIASAISKLNIREVKKLNRILNEMGIPLGIAPKGSSNWLEDIEEAERGIEERTIYIS
jgi:hypothetical protein